MTKSRAGFTLIELSIVLVIIALVTGGILVGRDMIKASQYRALLSEAAGYQVAVNTFKLKYGDWPGEFTKAEDLWGADPTGCPAGNTVQTRQQATCNGNGDGLMAAYIPLNNDYGPERLRIWQHLANAELIKGGPYTGRRAGSYFTSTGAVGLNVPLLQASGFHPNNVWSFINQNSSTVLSMDGKTVTRFYGPGLRLGRGDTGYTDLLPSFTTADLYAIDSKGDDGHPISGRISMSLSTYWSWAGALGSCNTTIGGKSVYDLSVTDIRCAPEFYL